MSITIRSATHADIEPLLDLIHSAYRGDRARAGWTHEADLLEGQRTDEEALREILDDSGQRILVVEEGGALTGCVQISDEGGDTAYLGMLSIAPERQAQGLGRALIQAAEDQSATLFGSTRMELTVIRQRTELIDYYERRGYRRTGKERPFPDDDPRFGIPQRRDLSFVVFAKPI